MLALSSGTDRSASGPEPSPEEWTDADVVDVAGELIDHPLAQRTAAHRYLTDGVRTSGLLIDVRG